MVSLFNCDLGSEHSGAGVRTSTQRRKYTTTYTKKLKNRKSLLIELAHMVVTSRIRMWYMRGTECMLNRDYSLKKHLTRHSSKHVRLQTKFPMNLDHTNTYGAAAL